MPQTEIVYLVASNTVKRQWIQRLGRVLRLSKATNKTKAIIHDFLVLPAIVDDDVDDDVVSLIKSEYERVSFFSALSMNGLEKDGSIMKINKLLELVSKK